MKTRSTQIGLLVLFLILLSACSTRVLTVTEKEYVPVLPPEVLLQEYSAGQLSTNEDLLRLLELNDKHNSDKRFLRRWRENAEGITKGVE